MRLDAYALQRKKVKIKADLQKMHAQQWLKDAIVFALESEPIELGLQILFSASGPRISASVEFNCAYKTLCSRCGAIVIHRISSQVLLEYLPDEQTGQIKTLKELDRISQELEIGASELDVGWYQSDGLEVSDVVSELIALEKPLQVHCTEDNVERQQEGTCQFESAEIEAKDNNPFANLFKLDS